MTKCRKKIFNADVYGFFKKRLGEIHEHYPQIEFIGQNRDKDYIHLQVSSGQAPHRRIIIKVENATYSFDPDMVLYVEAIGKVCTIHMMNRTMVIRQPITALEAQFPERFYRIHRSYLVNCRFILQVERYAATLINGTVLPIPAKRYMEVREQITALIK